MIVEGPSPTRLQRFLAYRLLLVLGLVTLAADQLTKGWIVARLPYPTYGEPGAIRIIEDFFYLVHVRNTGAAWSLFTGQSTVLALLAAGTLFVSCKGGTQADAAATYAAYQAAGATIAADTVARGAPQIFVELGGAIVLIRGKRPGEDPAPARPTARPRRPPPCVRPRARPRSGPTRAAPSAPRPRDPRARPLRHRAE